MHLLRSTCRSVLLTRLARIPLTSAVVARFLRREARCLQWVLRVGLDPGLTSQQRSACVRRCRRVAARLGHDDGTWCLLRSHFRLAGKWCRESVIRHADCALNDFYAAWRSGLAASRSAAREGGARRNSAGRYHSAWDQALDTWSAGEWLIWALDPAVWSAREEAWLSWAAVRWSVPQADVGRDGPPGAWSAACQVDDDDSTLTDIPAWSPPDTTAFGFHVFSDSHVCTSALQGRLRPVMLVWRPAWSS